MDKQLTAESKAALVAVEKKAAAVNLLDHFCDFLREAFDNNVIDAIRARRLIRETYSEAAELWDGGATVKPLQDSPVLFEFCGAALEIARMEREQGELEDMYFASLDADDLMGNLDFGSLTVQFWFERFLMGGSKRAWFTDAGLTLADMIAVQSPESRK